MEFCEAYSEKCYPFDEGVPTTPIPRAGDMPKGPVELPATGITYGFLLTIALVMIVLGTAMTVAVKKFR